MAIKFLNFHTLDPNFTFLKFLEHSAVIDEETSPWIIIDFSVIFERNTTNKGCWNSALLCPRLRWKLAISPLTNIYFQRKGGVTTVVDLSLLIKPDKNRSSKYSVSLSTTIWCFLSEICNDWSKIWYRVFQLPKVNGCCYETVHIWTYVCKAKTCFEMW